MSRHDIVRRGLECFGDIFKVDAKTFAEQDRAAEAGEIVAELMTS